MINTMKVLQHEHPLTLVDLNPEYPNDNVYDDEYDLIKNQAFNCSCGLCSREITFFHRYYYKCDQCDYSLHKLCKEQQFPTKLEHASHEIFHPSHHHPLIPLFKEILAKCDACGEQQEGVFYHCSKCVCSTCVSPFIHNDCVFREKRLHIQQDAHDRFSHAHPLILTYSFPKADQEAKFSPPCRMCDQSFSNYENLWVYKCEKCRYYVHLHCANLRLKPSYSGTDITILSNNEDDSNVLHLPFTDQTYNMISDFLFKKTIAMSLTHNSHKHPLIHVDTPTSSRITPLSFHDLMNKNEALCNGCLRPITDDMAFYKCTLNDQVCNFVLHDWCTRLPAELNGYRGHPKHTLLLLPKARHNVLGAFVCNTCDGFCNGFVYACEECSYYVDVICALLPKKIIHKSHPNHPLSRVEKRLGKDRCRMCLRDFVHDKEVSLSCETCKFHLHPECAISLPQAITHKYDKHPMTLTYSPAENYGGDYFCEVCEEELNPNACFYHCDKCEQSMHSTCAPLLPKSNTFIYDYGLSVTSVSGLVNIKFGSIHETQDHEHPLLLMQGTESDGDCTKCHDRLNGFFILKCLECKFAIHIHHYWW
ncbi:putative chromatin regulator PHD family [Helianthus annuus]|nr:putative chromatin regulator PHD family [Helianthus annuus]